MTAPNDVMSGATEPVHSRTLLSAEEAGRLTRLFKIFANETRLRLLHALVREGEVCVNDLAAIVDMKPQAVSNQLQRLVDRGIVGPRRQGTSIFYHIIDPCVPVLLERGLCLTECCPEPASSDSTHDSCCTQESSPCCFDDTTPAIPGRKKRRSDSTAPKSLDTATQSRRKS
jgi:DNA-binding transcriptional ArsR family regulator